MYCEMQAANGWLSPDEFNTCMSLTNALLTLAPKVELVVYLKVPVTVLQERIERRGRAAESGITPDLLSSLDERFDALIRAREHDVRIITLETQNAEDAIQVLKEQAGLA